MGHLNFQLSDHCIYHWFSNLSQHQNYMKGWLKHKVLVSPLPPAEFLMQWIQEAPKFWHFQQVPGDAAASHSLRSTAPLSLQIGGPALLFTHFIQPGSIRSGHPP